MSFRQRFGLCVLVSFGGLFLGACSPGGANNNVNAGVSTFTIGGNIAGLAGSVVLQNNSGDDLTLTANGAFTFATPLMSGAAYSVTVLTQPAGKNCTISLGSGTVAGANVTNVVADCVVPSALIAYVANGDSDDVTTFRIDPDTGELSEVGTAVAAGREPFSVTVDPTGRFAYVANRSSSDVTTFGIDPTTGALSEVGTAVAAGSEPMSVTVGPTGRFAYVANLLFSDVTTFHIHVFTGALHEVDTEVAAGTGPASVTVLGGTR